MLRRTQLTTRVRTAKLVSRMRLVVKVGTSLIAPGGRIDTTRMRALVDQLDLSRHEYLIVSSGAIASGMTLTCQFTSGPRTGQAQSYAGVAGVSPIPIGSACSDLQGSSGFGR